jgi:hypothetical protein
MSVTIPTKCILAFRHSGGALVRSTIYLYLVLSIVFIDEVI